LNAGSNILNVCRGLMGAWKAWRGHTIHSLVLRERLAWIVPSLQQRAVAAAWRRWRHETAEGPHRRAQVATAVARMRNQYLAKCWQVSTGFSCALQTLGIAITSTISSWQADACPDQHVACLLMLVQSAWCPLSPKVDDVLLTVPGLPLKFCPIVTSPSNFAHKHPPHVVAIRTKSRTPPHISRNLKWR